MRVPALCTLLGATLLSSHAGAQDARMSSGKRIEREGDAAFGRLKDAVAHRKGADIAPGPLPRMPADARARAAQALQGRLRSVPLERQAQAALEAGQLGAAREQGAMAKRLGQALGLEAPDMAAMARATTAPARKAWVPVLFVSSSMPTTTLRTYASQLARAGGVIAFRGMPGGMTRVTPMAKLSAEILRVDPGCEGPACAMRTVQLIVDPIVFRQHGVTRVPALAMVPGDPTQAYCERTDESPRAAHIVYGDAALSGLLDEIARLGGREEVRDAQSRLGAR